jgi:cytochrome c-type biogenesis protein CcmH/NrfG
MRKDSFLFLVIGSAIGFGILYFWTRDRAPEIVSQMPVLTSPQQQVSAASEPPAPPVDMARVQQLQAAIQANPQNFDALREMGNINFDQRNYKEATSWYSKALAVQPQNLDVRTDMATTMFYSEDFDGALSEFKKILQIEPGRPQALFNIGVAYLHGKNDPKNALASWEKLVALNPNYSQVDLVKEQIAALKRQMGGAQP